MARRPSWELAVGSAAGGGSDVKALKESSVERGLLSLV